MTVLLEYICRFANTLFSAMALFKTSSIPSLANMKVAKTATLFLQSGLSFSENMPSSSIKTMADGSWHHLLVEKKSCSFGHLALPIISMLF